MTKFELVFVCVRLGCSYRWSWFEARSKVCSAERQAQVCDKNKIKFGTYSKRIFSYVLYASTLQTWASRLLVLSSWPCLSCEGMRCAFLLGLQRYCHFISQGTVHSVPLSAYSNQSAVMLEESRGCEATTGWVWWLLSWRSCGQVEGKNVMTIKGCIGWLRRVEAVKLLQAGFGDYLADARVGRLKGKMWWQ